MRLLCFQAKRFGWRSHERALDEVGGVFRNHSGFFQAVGKCRPIGSGGDRGGNSLLQVGSNA